MRPAATRSFIARLHAAAMMATIVAVCLTGAQTLRAQSPDTPPPASVSASDYAIGAEDVLGIMVWDEEKLSHDVIVRPDGYITLPLINDVLAAGKTPTTLREHLEQLLRVYVKDPNVTVIVRAINSRKVSITGLVAHPGAYPLLGPMRALDLIAKAGGLLPTADARHLTVLRTERSGRVSMPLDYLDVSRGLHAWQDVVLRPGDTLVVP